MSLPLLLCPQTVHAYIDPGAGSYMVQVLIAGLLGALLSLKIFWARIRTRIKAWRPFGREDPTRNGRAD